MSASLPSLAHGPDPRHNAATTGLPPTEGAPRDPRGAPNSNTYRQSGRTRDPGAANRASTMTATSPHPMLNSATVVDYLRARGVLPSNGDPKSVHVSMLGGGVSNVVLAVACEDTRLVVKQALPRLRVRAQWEANRERALVEAATLRLLGSIVPGSVPQVIDLDADVCALTIEHAPDGWATWKSRLLDERDERKPRADDLAAAAQLGTLLARWHADTQGEPALACLADREVFVQLRVDPFYLTIAARHPELVEPVRTAIDEMEGFRRCLVHGDFSPKNVLLGEDGLWVIDCEVAHHGDPIFDVAFMLSHLILKAIARPPLAAAQQAYASAFHAAYQDAIPESLTRPGTSLLRHVGCLLVARVDGKSPVEYLDEGARTRARELGTVLAVTPPNELADIWPDWTELLLR